MSRPLAAALPSPGTSPKGTLPKSKIKSRKFLRETEDDSGELTIEDWIYRRDRFRSTSLEFPFPAPMDSAPLDASLDSRIASITELRPRVMHLLELHGLRVVRIAFFNLTKPGYPNGGDIPKPTLQIFIDAGDEDPLGQLSAARRDITAILDDVGLPAVEVEVIDAGRYYRPSFFPIHPNHPAVGIYRAVRHELLACLHSHIGYRWAMLSLFQVGRTANLQRPAVAVLVDPLVVCDWNLVVSRLNGIIARVTRSGPLLGVEVMPGRCGESPPAPPGTLAPPGLSDKPGLSFYNKFDAHPCQGTSIGVRGDVGGGTLGGWFIMRSPNKAHKGFLTNSHVVAPPTGTPETAVRAYNVFGLPYRAKDTDPARTWIQFFAVKDVEATRKEATKLEAWTREMVSSAREEIQRRQLVGAPTSEVQERLNVYSANHSTALTIIQKMAAMPTLLGRTIIASGRRLEPNLKTLDYAFVETGRTGRTNLPAKEEFDILKVSPGDLGLERDFVPDVKARGFSGFRPGDWYWKIGRTTGLTGGLCNGIDAWIPSRVSHTLFDAHGVLKKVRHSGRILEIDKETGRLVYDENGKPKFAQWQAHDKHGIPIWDEAGKPVMVDDERNVHYSSEWVIVNGSIDSLSLASQQTFCDLGDSGSLIMDINCKVAGLMFGDMNGACGPRGKFGAYTGAGLVTDIRDIKASLKVALGWAPDAQVDVLTLPE
ncbi:MAG: hypothetical protein Q9201_004802 [Fulgogasparrea decipioides]